eukprot:GEZU01034620.1.p1 GENE.GEZU01034620.1~~GEZU01034620.1.p1  ORF type:complete len:105 (-),score=3.35 GEZU01034620.1:183-497(-)
MILLLSWWKIIIPDHWGLWGAKVIPRTSASWFPDNVRFDYGMPLTTATSRCKHGFGVEKFKDLQHAFSRKLNDFRCSGALHGGRRDLCSMSGNTRHFAFAPFVN